MFVAVFLFIFSGFPVAFALGGAALLFAALGAALGHFDLPLLFAFPERIFGVMSNFVLLAVPFFIFMGTMLERSRLAEDLLRTIGLLFGPVRGGLALAVVFVGALLAAATGVVGASVVAMGLISLPVMTRYGYSVPLSTGVIAAAGTLGQIIPPSVVLVVLGDQLGVSVGDLFLGGIFPGLVLAGLYAGYVGLVALTRPAA
ncbi:MAG: TRAP transporter large permease subunit, partial [Gemmatimonadota bacterium]